jgi:hypothetical protein
LKAILVVPLHIFNNGIQYKYFLQRGGSSKRLGVCYEFIKIDGEKLFNRYVSKKNTWNGKDSEVIYHHYDDFVLPKLPEKTWLERAKSRIKKWMKGDPSLEDSLRREALFLYLNEHSRQSLSSFSPVPLHMLKLFHLVGTIVHVYSQLRYQSFYPHHGSYQWSREKCNERLSDDLEEWICSITDDHSATNVDIDAETESHTMAVGLVLLVVALDADVFAACSSTIANLLDLCRKVPEFVAISICRIKEQIYQNIG